MSAKSITCTGVALLLAASLSGLAQEIKPGAKAAHDFGGLRRRGFAPARGSAADAATGLPTRVVHGASGVVLVLAPAGEFLMGSPAGEAGRAEDERRHRRVVRRPFYIGETEVTAGQFRRFARAAGYRTDAERGTEEAGNGRGAFASTRAGTDSRAWTAAASWRNPFPNLKDYRPDERHPVVQVSWNDARRFAGHYGMELPTEAQWEYAARGGSRTRFFWGEAEGGGEGFGNFKDASGRRRFPTWNSSFAFDDGAAMLSVAGKYRPNAWGVYDVGGNVSEWCLDVFREDYPEEGADESAAEGERNAPRVIRGGSWLDAPDFNRSAKRTAFEPERRRDFIGFRVVVNL